jgi:hypothetical protein
MPAWQDEPQQIFSFFERIPDGEAVHNILGSHWRALHSSGVSSFDYFIS